MYNTDDKQPVNSSNSNNHLTSAKIHLDKIYIKKKLLQAALPMHQANDTVQIIHTSHTFLLTYIGLNANHIKVGREWSYS